MFPPLMPLRPRHSLPALLTAALMLPASAQAAVSWSSPVRIAEPGSLVAPVPSGIFSAPDGRSLAVFSDAGRPWLATGTVRGTFGAPAPLATDQAGAGGADAAVGANGTLAAAWAAGDAARVVVVPPGATSGSEAAFTGPGIAGAAVAVATDGAVTVAWRSRTSASSYSVLAATAPPGGTFGPAQTIDSGAGGMDAVDVAAGPGGALAVAYRKLSPKYRTHVAVRPVGASAFEAPQKLSAGDAADTSPRVAFGRDGTIFAAWANPLVTAFAMRPAGASAFAAQASLDPEGSFALDLVPTPQGGVAATWAVSRAIRAAVAPPGGAFGAPAPVTSTGSQIVPEPRIAVSPDGAATVLVADPASGEVRATDVGGATRPIGYGAIGQATPVAVDASADRTLALWRDGSGGISVSTRSAQAPPATGIGPKPAGPDRRRPKLTLLTRGKRIAVSTKTTQLTFKVRCDEACSILGMGSLRIVRPGMRRRISPLVTFRSRRLTAATQTVTLKLGTLARRDLRASLARGRGAQALIDLTATDAASNTTRTSFQRSLYKARKRR